jgi:shikimate kinase
MSVVPSPRSTPLNVVLIGFMGCGKTTLGHRLAEMLGFQFIDMDQRIVAHVGRPISEIFAAEGEVGFRKHESACLAGLIGTAERAVIATGGGVVTLPENHEPLRALGYIVWLNPPESALWHRISRSTDRPLLRTPNPRETVQRLLAERVPLYAALADLEADTKGLTPDEAAYGIAESVRVHFSRRQ